MNLTNIRTWVSRLAADLLGAVDHMSSCSDADSMPSPLRSFRRKACCRKPRPASVSSTTCGGGESSPQACNLYVWGVAPRQFKRARPWTPCATLLRPAR